MGFDGSWRAVEEVVVDIIDRRGVTPTKLGGEFTSSGHRVISAKLMKGGRLDLAADEPRFVEPSIYEKWMRSPLQSGDVLMTSEAPLGELAYMVESADWCLGQRLFALRPNTTLIDGRFLYYALQTAEVRADINSRASGTTVLGIRQTELRKVRVPVPSLDEQKLASSLLGALDDRIDLLRQTNAALEAIAQALFKSWFVDFDPVRANAEGREPEGMDAATAALFPSEFEESELGLIPRGWTIARLEEHVEAERGLSYKGAGLADQESGLPMHNLNSVLEGGGYKYAGIKFYKGDFKERHIAHAGDVVVANTEQGHHHRLIGFPAIVPRRFQRGLFSHHLYRVRIRDHSPITRHWIYRALMVPRVRDQIVGCANGSTVNMLKPAGLQIPRFVLPPGPLCERFEELAVALHARMETNVDFANDLAALRDTLLPRLISGKLRLTEPDIRVAKSSE